MHIYTDTDVPQQHATHLLTVLLALGTFFVALSLARFRRSRYLRSWIREFLADFGPAIALVVMALVAVSEIVVALVLWHRNRFFAVERDATVALHEKEVDLLRQETAFLKESRDRLRTQ